MEALRGEAFAWGGKFSLGCAFWQLPEIGVWCPGVRVMYGGFGGATVHGDVAYSTQICSLAKSDVFGSSSRLNRNILARYVDEFRIEQQEECL